MTRAVPAATQALAVLRYLATQPRPVRASALVRDLGIPRSSVYHLLSAMEAEGFVTRLPEEHRYGLGLAAFEIGSAYLRHDGIERLARPLLVQLVEEVAATAHLGILDGREVLYIVEERPRPAAPLVTDVGVRLPAHLTASGRSILAYLPRAHVRALYPERSALTQRTGSGPATFAELTRLLRTVRRQAYATEDEEITRGYATAATPAFDHTGRPVAAVAVTIARPRHGVDQTLSSLATSVRATADALTRRLRGVPPKQPT